MLIIPSREEINIAQALSEQYQADFEYNDFYLPCVLDDAAEVEGRIQFYKALCRNRSRDTMHGAFLDVTIHSQDEQIKKVSQMRVRQSMEIAARLGIRGVVFHTNLMPQLKQSSYVEHWVQSSAAFWTAVGKEYEGIEIYLENMFDDSPKPLLSLAEAMKGQKGFGICLDYAHATLFGENVEEWIGLLGPYIKHMHINDNDLEADLHLAIGDGRIDWQAYDRYMKQTFAYETAANAALAATAAADAAGRAEMPSVLIEVSDLEKAKKSLAYLTQHCLFMGR